MLGRGGSQPNEAEPSSLASSPVTAPSTADRAAPSDPQVVSSSPWDVPSFRLLWINALSFFLVANALRFLYGWVVLDGLGLGEGWQGFIVFVLGVPSFLLLAPAGVWADRLDPKKILLVTQTALVLVMVGTAMALGSGAGSRTILIVSALAAGAASSTGGPVRSSLIPRVLSQHQLFGGIALNAIAMTLSLVVGAAAARLFGDWFGFDGAFYYMAAVLLVGLGAISRFASPGPALATGDGDRMRSAIREGANFVWDNRGIRTLFILLSVSGLLMSPLMMVTSQAHIKSELGRSAGDAAPMFAVMGIGIALSSIYIMKRNRTHGRAVLFMRSMLVGSAVLCLMGFTTAYWQMLLLAGVLGLCGGIFFTMNQGLIQANTPQPVMGRVMSVYSLVQVGLLPLGALALGLLSSQIGTGVTMTAAAALSFVLILAAYVSSPSIRKIN